MAGALEVVQGSKTQYLFHAVPFKDFALSLIINIEASLVQAVLSLATVRTRSCPRSLSLTLLKNVSQNVKLDLFRHRLMAQCEENMTTQKKWTTSSLTYLSR